MKDMGLSAVRQVLRSGFENIKISWVKAGRAIAFRKHFGCLPYTGHDSERLRVQKMVIDRKLGAMAKAINECETRYRKISSTSALIVNADTSRKRVAELKRDERELGEIVAIRTYEFQEAFHVAKAMGVQTGEKDQYIAAYGEHEHPEYLN